MVKYHQLSRRLECWFAFLQLQTATNLARPFAATSLIPPIYRIFNPVKPPNFPIRQLTSPPPPSFCSCKPLLIATYNPEEGPLREHLLDRIAITLSADVPSEFNDRVLAVAAAQRFQDEGPAMLDENRSIADDLRTKVGSD